MASCISSSSREEQEDEKWSSLMTQSSFVEEQLPEESRLPVDPDTIDAISAAFESILYQASQWITFSSSLSSF